LPQWERIVTTQLAAHDLDPNQLDLLQLVADNDTPLGRLHRDDFEAACRAVADADGWVNPNAVSAWLHARWGEIDPRWYSAQWAPACGPKGFLIKTDAWVPIDGEHSRGNSGKSVRMRRLRPQ
jgi:hypothetical protein